MTRLGRFTLSMTNFVTVLILSAGLLARPCHATSQELCASLLGNVNIETIGEDFVKANGIAVTGDSVYPIDMVTHNLGLNQIILNRFKGEAVLSLAEGASGLLPFLLDQGFQAKGLDLWYGLDELPSNYSGQLMRDYVQQYGDHLVQSDARSIPWDDETAGLVVSHMLVNNVDTDVQKDVIKEAIRVVKQGGQVRLFGFDQDDVSEVTDYLSSDYQRIVSFSFETKKWDLLFRGRRVPHKALLLIIDKLN